VRRVAAIPALALLAGAAAGLILPDPPLRLWPIGVVLATAAGVAIWTCISSRSATLLIAAGVGFAAGGALLGARAWQQAWRPSLRLAIDQQRVHRASTVGPAQPELQLTEDQVFARLVGILRSDATVRAEAVSVSLDVRSIAFSDRDPAAAVSGRAQPVRGGVLLTVGGVLAASQVKEWRAGRTVALPAQLRQPSRHLDPGVPDEERALARRGTTLVGSVKSGALVDVVARGSVWSEAAASARAFVRQAVARHVGRWSATSAALVTAILIGDRGGLHPDLERTLQEAGTYHVIAISGGNIAILATLTLAAFRWAGVLGRSAMLTAVAAFLAYGFIVEGGASVDRAVLTAVLYFLARAIDHRVEPLQGLSVAAAGLVAVDPLAVADPAFLLSFGATAAIIWVSPAVPRLRASRLIGAGLSLLLASAAAEIALLPVSAYFFGRVTLAGLLLNLGAIPLMGLAQVAGTVLLPVAFLGPAWLADGCGFIAHLGAEALVVSGGLVEYMSAATWRVARPSPPAIAAYYIGGLIAWRAWRSRRQGSATWPVWRMIWRSGAVVAATAAVWIALEPWATVAARGDGRLHVTFVDVGQGDAAFVRFPHGATMLVDAGGSPSTTYDVGERVVGPVLRDAGVRRIGTVVVTHGDADHAGGAISMVRELRPFDVWEGVPVPRLPLRQRLRAGADAVGARWTNVQRNDALLVDQVRVSVLHPDVPDWERQATRNDDSIVLELRWRDVSFVLAGDIGRRVEQMLVPQLEAAPLRVLKVPHHGSLTSSSWPFLERLAPTAAVFSAGRGNPFGHPAPEVLARYEAIGAEIFRTDRDGAVFFDTDGYHLNGRTFLGRTVLWPGHHDSTKGRDDQTAGASGR
jgi:competence protein ComEC